MSLRTARYGAAVAATVAVSALTLTGCGGSGGGDSEALTSFSVLSNVENEAVPGALTALAEGACKAENDALPLKIETVPQANLDQQLQLLAGQGGLPVMFAAGGAPALTKTLAESGDVADLGQVFSDLGIEDDIEPAALSTIESLYGGFNVLPTEFNIEGIWYNKAYFEEYGIGVPETWDELVDAAQTLQDEGKTAFAASGEQGWPITRLIGNYIFRDLGPDAMTQVSSGDAKLTDPEYVTAATKVAELGAAGYFGQGVGSIDYDTAINEFLNGNAGMLYMGSWVLSNFANEDANAIGTENIGFMPFPDVEGGAGNSGQMPANVGLPFTFNAKAMDDENVQAWVKCFADNYGSVALSTQNRISGFTLNEEVDVDELTGLVQEQIASTDDTVLWFEADFGSEALTTSTTNVSPMVTGDTTPDEYMSLIQADLDQQ